MDSWSLDHIIINKLFIIRKTHAKSRGLSHLGFFEIHATSYQDITKLILTFWVFFPSKIIVWMRQWLIITHGIYSYIIRLGSQKLIG